MYAVNTIWSIHEKKFSSSQLYVVMYTLAICKRLEPAFYCLFTLWHFMKKIMIIT